MALEDTDAEGIGRTISERVCNRLRAAVIGATGPVGSCVVRELSERGHEVTALTTHPDAVAPLPGVTAVEGNANDGPRLAGQVAGHDVVISSIRFAKTDPDTLIGAVKDSGVPRYVVVGGSGTLLVPGTTTRIMDTPAFPASFAAPAAAAARFFDRLRRETELDWTYLSPPPGFGPGERTGRFRLGLDELLSDDAGTAAISYDDFAIAFVDEVEDPKHRRRRFSVAY